jgi:hypothetical protein
VRRACGSLLYVVGMSAWCNVNVTTRLLATERQSQPNAAASTGYLSLDEIEDVAQLLIRMARFPLSRLAQADLAYPRHECRTVGDRKPAALRRCSPLLCGSWPPTLKVQPAERTELAPGDELRMGRIGHFDGQAELGGASQVFV